MILDGTGPRVAILDYDAGNVHSAMRGFAAAGARPFITRSPREAATADVLVIPGVGHFATCLAALRASGLVDVVASFITDQRPVFGICVGMQLLYERSAEGEEPGLGLLPGAVARFPDDAVVPHMGWDVVHAADAADDDPLLAGVAGERLYFVHSYYAVPTDPRHVVGRTRYGGVDFPCLVREGSVVGAQFHPEKSGPVGARLLTNWLASL
ncbi:MAG: imidazole glycerol phosphate synthase subunit HisH [Nitriliruptoraceae bacterium]|nr:imidazole glycerol phosphate synthase subunit HisH [Nitriliruptoraceae bacterium]